MAPKKYFPLLVCSLGNPGPTYASTLHSTGHTILSTIQSRALYQPFTKGLSGLISRPNTQRYRPTLIHGYIRDGHNTPGSGGTDDITLWQSTSYMNVSGVSVKRAWAAFREEKRKEGLEARLVVVHDELESEMGRVGVKEGGASARGHNGLKSVQGALGQGEKWWRVGVGIGRPESREAEVVSRYVLRKMSAREGDRMERAAAEVLRVLGDVYDGTRN
ncbi:peptidyl-tRNA hydrolase [Polyplosphaeria fusca]|uniref:peptidyl-tRNA hydrolase n=1 Tax=Polyplosphaeria fusca TaxID=682080 RepID=A0A9P4UYA9_9PLEO|nr:peptidyl-tRNA hydrolase [Polyplosphaeria fusca]